VFALFLGLWGVAGFCFTVVGWLLSYIWFNVYPARFMMGDVGSFALGAGLGVVAMMTNAFLLLPVIGVLFVVEAGSVVVQVFSKKVLGRKVFISSPIHHHLEAKGWEETKITMRFWVLSGVAAFVGMFLALGGGIIR
jgi:phospho-N-acetylmuramoyl-pentapeptide-transferase